MALQTTQPLVYLLTRGGFYEAPSTPSSGLQDYGGGKYAYMGSSVMGGIRFDTAVMLESPFVSDTTPASIPIDGDPPFPAVFPYTWNTGLFWGRENLTQNLRCIRGNTLKFTFHVTQDGENIDITTAALTLTAKWDVRNTGNVFQLTVGSGLTITDGPTGQVSATISSAQTSTGIPLHQVPLYYDVEMVLNSEVSTVLFGVLTISPNVTNI
jgi:hypothetical protein